MNGPPVALSVTIEDYLSNPAYEHCEYVQGAVLEMNVGTGPHANAQLNCGSILRQYFLKKGGGKAFTELRYRLQIDGQVRFYQPDVAAVLGSTSVDFKFLDRSPDLVVEVRSPDDRLHELFRKAEDYFAGGAKAVWLVEPGEQCVYVLLSGLPARILTRGETIDGGVLLPDFAEPVDSIFA
jgi:Uma2 family endonuclease